MHPFRYPFDDYGPWSLQESFRAVPSDPEAEVDHLILSATQYGGGGIGVLEEAISICRQHQLTNKESRIHCQLSEINLRRYNLDLALAEANEAISTNPNSEKGYYCRAEAIYQQGKVYERNQLMTEAHNEYTKCVEDFMKSYTMSGKVVHAIIVRAIGIALEQDLTHLLKLQDILSSNECVNIIKFMMSNSHSGVRSKHINYLVLKNDLIGSGVVQDLSCDLSDLSWTNIIFSNIVKSDVMKVIISQGAHATIRDLNDLIKSEKSVKLFELSMKNCIPKLGQDDLLKLTEQALKDKKFEVVHLMLLHGVKIEVGRIVQVMRPSDLKPTEKIVSHLMSIPEGQIALFFAAVNYSEYNLAESFLCNDENESIVCKLCVNSILEFPLLRNLETRQRYVTFVNSLLERGVNVKGDGKSSPLDIVLKIPKEYEVEKIKLLTLLLRHGAEIERCTYQRENRTTLIHIAAKLVIDSPTDPERMELLEEVCKHYPYPEDGRVQDKKGDTPYHIIMVRKRSPTTIKMCQILSQYRINPSIRNEHRKKPRLLETCDPRAAMMQEAVKQFETQKKKGKRKKKGKPSEAFQSITSTHEAKTEDVSDLPPKEMKTSEDTLDSEDVIHDINDMLLRLSQQPKSYFKPPPDYKKQPSVPHDKFVTESAAEVKELPAKFTNDSTDEQAPAPSSKELNIDNIASNFEGRSWEVECTDKVKKFFGSNKVPRNEKEAVVKTIDKLVDGIPINNPKLCKEVRSNSKLYESRYSGGSRIIFELAVQFSPRLTSGADNKEYIYCEVIRLWDVVRDHGGLSRHIDHVVECIKKSQERGKTAAIPMPLKVPKLERCTQGQLQMRLPQVYVLNECNTKIEEVQNQLLNFYPSGSTREDEYNVVTFYSFDDSFVKSMLNGENDRRDFPFKEWPKEHDIISMPQGKVSILLLGRSGTGKTTCCLYRLWNQFQAYWLQAAHNPLIPRRALPSLESQSQEEHVIESSEITSEKENCSESEDCNINASPCAEVDISQPQLEHFHQVFITKNYVLCAQMKKRFYDLAAGKEVAIKHVDYEDADLPTSLCDIKDHAFPLFLTARQFFLLLDNSLQDDKNFFRRDEQGELLEKIVSSDYDHEDPDTLLDLEESDSNDELGDSDFDEDFGRLPVKEKKRLQQRREVTASYFAEKIWPKISKKGKLQNAKIDPLLVWMEIKSFIKGSREAVHKREGYLMREEYEELGKKMAPNYVSARQDIYDIFEHYKHFVSHVIDEDVFDECDLNHNIFSRLNAMKDLPWSIHSIYIDEVQDFTQAELSILLRICRNPNDLFFTGDTAQSIMRGIAFRFGDVTSIFYHAAEQLKKVPKSIDLKVPKVDELTINFRSHTGVLKLAASVIDLMKEFFPSSFDCLPGDEGMFPGPSPIVLDSCNVSDLALVLRTNKRESSTIEFGAHQVIIVQNEEAKKNIPDVLKAGIVLTVFESKGLEFDDVLLYNFFKDSKVDKDWRVVTSFIQDHPDQIINNEVKFSEKPRMLEFDQNNHKSLNAELKYLYTAITRAKCNLWIHDSDEQKRLPIFDYWYKKSLVKVIRVSDISSDDQGALFSATSSKAEWKSQGDYFKRKKLWEPAMKCFQKAECPHLESEARAYSLAQQARTPGLRKIEVEEIYLKSAHAFLKCDQSQHDYQCLENAAKCLKNSRKYGESSQLYIYLDQMDKALKGLRRINRPQTLAMVKDKLGEYDSVIRLLMKHNCFTEALEYAAKYEAEKRPISKVHQVRYLAGRQAEKLVKLQNETPANEKLLQQFETVLEYLPLADQVAHFKSAGMHDKACEVLIQMGKYEDLYRIYAAQGWHEEGIQLAKQQKKKKWETDFILFKASSELDESGEIMPATLEMLKRKRGTGSESEAKASLIYGIGMQNPTSVWLIYIYYKRKYKFIGQVEALSAVLERAVYDEQSQKWKNIHTEKNEDILDQVIAACKEIKILIEAIKAKEPDSVQGQILNEIETFYGLHKKIVDKKYNIPPSSYPWTNELLKKCNPPEVVKDADGMLQFKLKLVKKAICNRLSMFVKRWIIDDEFHLVRNFCRSLAQHPLHGQMLSGGYITSYSSKSLDFQDYFNMLSKAYNVACQGNTKLVNVPEIVTAVLSVISPQATCYLPISSLNIKSDHLLQRLQEQGSHVLAESDENFEFDQWYEAWRVSCVTKKGWRKMKDVLITRSSRYSKQLLNKDSFLSAYVLDSSGRYKHVMLLWITACDCIRSKNMFPACTIAVHNVVRHIALNKAIWTTISVSNFLHIVTIHTTALLTMYATCFACQWSQYGHEGNIYISTSYKQITEIFQNMNSIPGVQTANFLKSCIDHIARRQDIAQVRIKLFKLLTIILEVMIGIHNEAFNPLSYALRNDSCISNHEAHHCLTLVLTIFGNIGLMTLCHDLQLQRYRKRIYDSVKHCNSPLLRDAFNRFATSATIVGTFGAVKRLSETTKDELACVSVFFNQTHRNFDYKFGQAQLMKITQKRLLPIEIDSTDHDEPQNPIAMRAPSTKLSATAKEFHPKGLNLVPSLAAAGYTSGEAEPTPEFTTQDSIEVDPEAIDALQSAQTPDLTDPTVPENRHPMVDEVFCRLCVCPLSSETAAEEQDGGTETYSYHCRTETHNTNIELYSRFNSTEEDHYKPLKEALQKLLSKSAELFRDLRDGELQEKVEKVEGELSGSNNEILKIRNSAEWRLGVTLLENELLDKLEMLRLKMERTIETSERKKQDLQKAEDQEERKGEEENNEVYESDGEEEIVADKSCSGEKIRKNKRRAKERRRKRK